MTDPHLMLILKISTGLFWTFVYILIIKRGFQDKTFGMPMVALCANLAWEFTFSFIYPHGAPQRYINIIWFLFDIVILFQFLKYGRKEYKEKTPFNWFPPTFLVSLSLSFLIVLSITIEFQDWVGKYTAFAMNFLMSVLFVSLLAKRNNVTGQSMYIAIFKMIGTLFPSILFYIYYPSLLIIIFSILIFIFDCIYIVLLFQKFYDMEINPWTRKGSTINRKMPAVFN